MLFHLGNLYVIRNASLWKRDEIQSWLLATSEKLLSKSELIHPRVMESQLEEFKSLSQHPFISRYEHALEEDFQDGYNRLPPEANPLDPMLADPRVLRGEVRFQGARGARGARRNQLEQMLANQRMGGIDEEAVLAEFQRLRELGIDANLEDIAAQFFAQGGAENNQLPIAPGNLDPNLPLMQLFLQMMLPWNRLNMGIPPEHFDDNDDIVNGER